MVEPPIQLSFNNRHNPQAGFDMVALKKVLKRTYENHSPYEIHRVDFFIIMYIAAGQGSHIIDFKEYTCTPGTVLTIRKDQIHQFQPNQDLEGYLLLFTNEFLISYLEQLEAQKSLQLFNELLGEPRVRLAPSIQPEVAALMARLHREYFEVNDGYSLGIIRSELHILIAQLYRAKSQLYPLIQPRKYLESFIRFQELAEAHVKETTRVQDYAEMMGVSTKTLNTITREMLNKSAKAFLDEICIMQVKRLLIHTPLSIKEIAFAAGFDEPSNFYKYFRRHVAQTPEAFRLSFQ